MNNKTTNQASNGSSKTNLKDGSMCLAFSHHHLVQGRHSRRLVPLVQESHWVGIVVTHFSDADAISSTLEITQRLY